MNRIDPRRRDHLSNRLAAWKLGAAVCASALIALTLTSCTQVAGTVPSSLIRVIDASYIAPALNVTAEGETIAANAGRGTITQYGTIDAANSALILVSNASGVETQVQAKATLLAGQQESVFIADNGAAATEYAVTVLEDQSNAAPSGSSSFRFLNQAPKTGAVDLYMIPAGSTVAKSTPLFSHLAAGSATGYINFTAQTVTLVVTSAGSTKARYTSPAIALTGGEVRTSLILDSTLTSNPSVEVLLGDDVN